MNPQNKLEIIEINSSDILEKNIGKTEINVIKYNEEEVREELCHKCPEIKENETTWIEVTNISNDEYLNELFKCFKINENLLETILRIDYIPEVEDHKNYVYIQLTGFYINDDYKIESYQVSIILGKNYVISFHHDDGHSFKPLRDRLRTQEHQIRGKGADYLAYTLIDTILDSHVNTLKQLEGEISKASEKIMDNPSNKTFRIIHDYREELDKIRYYILPLQQIINSMELTESLLINQSTSTFLKNFRNHVTQVIHRIDTLSNRITEMREVYNSSMSRRLDEIVRVLTVVTVLFVPGTFIVGIYGMNFKFMPELDQEIAYPIVLIINFSIIISMIIYFKRKNWI
ncbi:MAG: magnesium/cobalt transporter CorA [Methanobacterium sp.]